MSPRLPALLAAAAAALLLVGCQGGGDAEPAGAATPDDGAVDVVDGGPASDGSADTDPEPAGGAPLTGLPLDERGAEQVLERPVVALKIDNAPAARPQSGLDEAEIVFVELVEGGLTRFVALYHAARPERVGPVRSAREADAKLLPPLDPVFAHSGAAPPVLRALHETGMALREEGQPRDAWRRDPSRRAPHNLFADPGQLPRDLSGAGAGQRPWPIWEAGTHRAVGSAGEEIGGVTLRYSAAAEAAWAWDAGRDTWVRSQDGEPHVAESGEAIAAANVVVAQIEVSDGGRADAAGNPVVEMTLEGEGPALVLSGGRAVEARWHREPGGRFAWQTPDGEPLGLSPGRTWIELVPEGRGAVETDPPGVG